MTRERHAGLHYRLEGPAGAPIVVLANSLGTSLSLWDAQTPALTRQFRVLRYDARGHGLSASPAGAFTLDDLGRDVLALLDAAGIERFHVCGVSLGGMTALWLAIHARERVLSVMACNTAARIGSEAGWNARIEQVAAHGLASIAGGTMERWFTPAFRARSPERVAATRAMLLGTDPRAYLACCAAIRDTDLSSQAGAITAPCLVISGTYDVVTPPSDGLLLQSLIPKAAYRELPAAHLSNIEAADAFLSLMLEFLSNV